MTTLERVQSAAQVASRQVGGPARAALMEFIDALEAEIENKQIETDRAVAELNLIDQEIKQ